MIFPTSIAPVYPSGRIGYITDRLGQEPNSIYNRSTMLSIAYPNRPYLYISHINPRKNDAYPTLLLFSNQLIDDASRQLPLSHTVNYRLSLGNYIPRGNYIPP